MFFLSIKYKYLSFITKNILIFFVIVFAAFLPSAADGHETDQYTVPVGREFADLRYYISNEIYHRISSAVEKVNIRIVQSLKDNGSTEQTARLQSPSTIASAVYAEFPSFVYHIHVWEAKLHSSKVQTQFPGLVVAHKPPFWIYHHWALVIDPTKLVRLVRTSTIMVDGTYMGTDKISHFIDMGYAYYLRYLSLKEKEVAEGEATSMAVNMSSGYNLFFSESMILGSLTTGIKSNADLAANYAGFKFYQNLTEEEMLKGKMRPPMLVRNGEYWTFNDHVRPNSDFFSIFVSDHFDEALNPNDYMLGMNTIMRKQIRNRCDNLLQWYRDDRGNLMDREKFANINMELTTYYGEDYGHSTAMDDVISISSTCFADNDMSDGDSSDGAAHVTRLASAEGDLSGAIQVNAGNMQGESGLPEKEGINNSDKFGRTALWWAARFGDIDGVKRLIDEGADMDIKDIDGESPLHSASRWGHEAITELLLIHGADANVASIYGVTPLHLAVREMHGDVIEILLKHGADANARDLFGCTPLHDIADSGNGKITDMLVAGGADPQAKDINGTTPLHRAARSGNTVVVKTLLLLGADPALKSYLGRTPLDEALLQANNEDVVKSLSPDAQGQYILP
jgi:ankyrin repeat protein